MTETKFTPGPWQLCAHLKNINEEIGCSCGYRGVIFGPEDAGFAICQPGHEPSPAGQEGTEPPRYPRETEIANAHLIAAAPDLYEALEKATLELKQLHHDLFHTLYKNDEIEKALKKARGETE